MRLLGLGDRLHHVSLAGPYSPLRLVANPGVEGLVAVVEQVDGAAPVSGLVVGLPVEVEDDAVFLPDLRAGTGSPADALKVAVAVRRVSHLDHGADRRDVHPLLQQVAADERLEFHPLELRHRPPRLPARHRTLSALPANGGGGDSELAETVGGGHRGGDAGSEDHGLAILDVPDDVNADRLDPRPDPLAHVARRVAFVLLAVGVEPTKIHLHGHLEFADGDQPAVLDRVGELVGVGRGLEDRPEFSLVAPARRGGDPQVFGGRKIAVDVAILFRQRAVALVGDDHSEVISGVLFEPVSRERLDGAHTHVVPGSRSPVDSRVHGDAQAHVPQRLGRLLHEPRAMGDEEGAAGRRPLAQDSLAGHPAEHGFTRARG